MRQDYGEYIGGAHKERWAKNKEDRDVPSKQDILADLDYQLLAQHIVESLPSLQITPADIDAKSMKAIQRASGFDANQIAAGIAFGIKKAIDAIPNPKNRWDIEKIREFATELKWLAQQATTLNNHLFTPLLFRLYGRDIIINKKWNNRHPKGGHLQLFGKKYVRATYRSLAYYIQRAKNEGFLTEIAEEDKIYPSDPKKVIVKHEGRAPVIYFMATPKWPIPIVSCFCSQRDAVDVANRNRQTLVRQGKWLYRYERDALKRTNLDEHVRDGPEWFTSPPTNEEFMELFKIRGGEWGNYINGKEREAHMLQLANAFMDLSQVMGLPPAFIGFNGWLAIAIGSRGIPGSQAHFEPDKKVINLTKKQGAGALAHEWGHLTELRITNVTFGVPGRVFASEYLGRVKGFREDKFGIRKAAYRMLKTITQPGTVFAGNAAELDEKTGREYWSNPPELFARAFEAYVESKCLNTYLVHGTRSGPLYERGLYPEGKEAIRFFTTIEDYFKAVRAAVKFTESQQQEQP